MMNNKTYPLEDLDVTLRRFGFPKDKRENIRRIYTRMNYTFRGSEFHDLVLSQLSEIEKLLIDFKAYESWRLFWTPV